jgi:hypothetical protein
MLFFGSSAKSVGKSGKWVTPIETDAAMEKAKRCAAFPTAA